MTDACDTCYGQTLLELLEGPWRDLPGYWTGYDEIDLAFLRSGFPANTKTEEDWMRHKMYDAALEHVMAEARYTSPEGDVHYVGFNADDKLELLPVEPCDEASHD